MPHLLDQPLVIVDVETTGTSYRYGGVIDVGVLRVENGHIVRTFAQLINPGSAIPAFITQLTGITNDDLADAPSFKEISPDLFNILDGALFVAHNARFDYAFIKEEFRRVGEVFSPKTFCTVRLSRALYPGWINHKLSTLIEKLGITTGGRHRALADAEATWQALQIMTRQSQTAIFDLQVKQQLRQPTLPAAINKSHIDALPEGPGVYIFEASNGATLYVGKSITIKQRVLSHFGDDHRSTKELRIAQEITSIRTIQTHGELGALLTESQQIKELMPLHNRRLRRKTDLVLALRTTSPEGYPTIILERHGIIDPRTIDQVMAVYTSERAAKEALLTLAKEYYLCHKLLHLQKTTSSCFPFQLKRCLGACIGEESPQNYTLRLDEAFAHTRLQIWPYTQPLLITEELEDLPGSSGYLIDQWCLLAQIAQCDQDVSITNNPLPFDLDHYKIIKRYITQPQNRRHIKLLSPQQLQQLTSQEVYA